MRVKLFILMVIATAGVCNATIDWYYDSPLTVNEAITDIGDGEYRYEYSLENVDTSPIWGFGIYTTFAVTGENTFVGPPQWHGPVSHLVTAVLPEYDARNLDPDILYITYDATSGGAMPVGGSASGFSFISSVYNTSPKYYMYETIESGDTQTNGTGKVAAVGTTIPEPITLFFFGAGAIAILKRKQSI